MLCGPERSFRNAKAILPWHDEDDSPQGHKPSPRHLCFLNECKGVVAVQDEQHLLEQSPFSSLPRDWQKSPRSFGITISVLEPSSSVGEILRHCKDQGLINILSCLLSLPLTL